jgi:hypothetical protein
MTAAFLHVQWRRGRISGLPFRLGSMQIKVLSRTSSVSTVNLVSCLFDTLRNPSRQSDLNTIYKHLHQPGDGKSTSIHEHAQNIIYLALWREESVLDIASNDPREAGRHSEEHFCSYRPGRGLPLCSGSHVQTQSAQPRQFLARHTIGNGECQPVLHLFFQAC